MLLKQDPSETPPPTRVETREERLERRRKEKAEQVAYKLEREIAIWDPTQLQEATEDPFKTLFIARIVCFCHTLWLHFFPLSYKIATEKNVLYGK